MRRGLAGLILGLSLVVASISWSGFVMTRTVLDPKRSERLADQMLDNETLRAAIVSRLSDAMGAALPAEVPVPRQQLEQAAEAALEDERVEALVRDGLVRTHQNALEGNSEDITVDASALGAASRDSLVDIRPELDGVLPQAPTVEIELPTSGLSWLGSVRRTVARFTTILGLTALAGALLALLVTKDRPAVLRRVSFWAFGTALFWMIVGFGIPYLAQTIAPSSAAIVAAIVDVFFGAMIAPAIIMAIVGGVLLGASMLWQTMALRRPAALVQPRRQGRVVSPVPDGDRSVAATAASQTGRVARVGQQRSNVRPSTSAGTTGRVPTTTAGSHPIPGRPATHAAQTWNEEIGLDPTAVFRPPSEADADATRLLGDDPATAQTPKPPSQSPRWVEGVGYVEDDEPS